MNRQLGVCGFVWGRGFCIKKNLDTMQYNGSVINDLLEDGIQLMAASTHVQDIRSQTCLCSCPKCKTVGQLSSTLHVFVDSFSHYNKGWHWHS